ncbi:MAG: FAD-dependent oxidoreductase [Niabella sp.]
MIRLLFLIVWGHFYFFAPAQYRYDVVIYGATPGGIAAAIQTARMGKSVALIEPSQHIGGHITGGLGSPDIDNHKEFRNSLVIGGIAMEFYQKLAVHYNRATAFEAMLQRHEKNIVLWKAESSVAEAVFENWLREYKIPVFKGQVLAEGEGNVVKRRKRIRQIRMDNGSSFSGTVFIDAGYEGDLLYAAGVRTVTGREDNKTYNETLNGIRGSTTHAQFAVKVDPYLIPGNPASGLIPTIQDEPLGTPGAGDASLQAYCFRVCLTDSMANQIAFSKPAGYNRSEYEIYIRYLKAGGKLYTPKANLPNRKTDLGAWHDLSHNLYGMNRAYPNGSYEQRKKVLDDHARFTKGLFYFLATDTAVARLSPALQKEWKRWGYARDEFTDNGGFPRVFYVRDARRMVSGYVITEHHFKKVAPESVSDPVAVAFWPPDVHSVRRIVRNGYAYNEGAVFSGDNWRPFGISYRALVPRLSECKNILTPTCPSASHIAFGAMRLEHNFMDMGQACATAAVLAIHNRRAVQKVRYSILQKQLIKDKLIINAPM